MRIAFVSYEFPPDTGKGGIGTYVHQIAAAMSDSGIEVHVFAGSAVNSGLFELGKVSVHLTICNDAHEFRERVLNEFDSVHRHSPFDLIESAEINGNAWEIKIKYPLLPLIVRLHAPGYLVENLKKKYLPLKAKLRFVIGSLKRFSPDLGYWRKYEKSDDPDYQFVLLANYITAPSEAMKKWAVNNWSINADKIKVIPNIFYPAAAFSKSQVFEQPVYKTVVFFGRLNVLKGLVNATVAMEKILKEFPDWKFKVIGDDGPGPYQTETMRSWMKNKLAQVITRVEFFDGTRYENLPALIDNTEIALLPSLFESFSYTCAEAMAAGKAVVGSYNGGMAMLLKNEESGMLVNPESTKEIYLALKKMISNNELRYQISLNARRRIVEEFDAGKVTLEFYEYYQNICGR